jgi:hypothetical protein
MKTIIKDLTGEMPVQDIDEKLGIILMKHYKGNDYITDDAVNDILALFADKPKGKPIEFVWFISCDGEELKPTIKPSDFSEINLIYKDYHGYDIFITFDKNGCKYQYHGHWNDGYVEGNDN